MAQSLTKQEKLVLTGLVVCCVGLASFISNFEILPKAAQAVESIVNYKMGKASEEISAYSLEGRQVERILEKQDEESFVAKTVRKISEIINKKSDKKAAKKTEQKTAAKKLPNQEFSKPVAKASPVTAQSAQSQKDATHAQAEQDLNNNNYAPVAAEENTQPAPQEAKQDPKKVKKSLEQIRTEFMANPSKEAMMAVVTSYKKNEISSVDFYQFQSELLESQNDALVGHALYALRLTPSTESFTMMAQYQSSAKQAYQTYIEEALLAYNQSGQITVLGSVLRSGDKVVIMKAMQVIETGINNIKNGTVSQLVDGRNRRETTFSNYSLQNYMALLPAITQALASSHDTELSASLEQLKNLINENNTQVAANP